MHTFRQAKAFKNQKPNKGKETHDSKLIRTQEVNNVFQMSK